MLILANSSSIRELEKSEMTSEQRRGMRRKETLNSSGLCTLERSGLEDKRKVIKLYESMTGM